MTRDDARDTVMEWQRTHPKENLSKGFDLTKTGAAAADIIQKYSLEAVNHAMAMVELHAEKFVPRFGTFLKHLYGMSTGDGGAGLRKWQNGDVLEFNGNIGVISRDDSCEYIGWQMPLLSSGQLYWQSGDRYAGQAHKLSPEDAEAWIRKWYKIKTERSGETIIGLDYAMAQLPEEELDMSVIPF